MADDGTLCNVCRGTGRRLKVTPAGHYRRITCYRCQGSGKWTRVEDAWPYTNKGRPL